MNVIRSLYRRTAAGERWRYVLPDGTTYIAKGDFDLARSLLADGYTGFVTIHRPPRGDETAPLECMHFAIEGAAALAVFEGAGRGHTPAARLLRHPSRLT